MKDEPGIDLSNPSPEPLLPMQDNEYKERVMELLQANPWINLQMSQQAAPFQEIRTFGGMAQPELVQTGPGSITFTITVCH